MFSIFIRTIRDWKYSIIAYSLSCCGLIWMYMGLYPTIQKQSENYMAIMQNFPKVLLDAFGIEPSGFSSLETFISTENFSFMWPIIAIIFVASLAGGFIAAEIEKGTIEYLLAQPLSRLKLFLSRYSVGIIAIIFFVLLSVTSAIPFAKAYNFAYDSEGFWMLSLLCFLFLLAIYSLGMLASAIFNEKGKVYFSLGALLVLMYIANIVASLKENLSDLKYFSFFYYFNYSHALMDHHISRGAWVVFISVTIVSVIVGCVWFKKKDIAV